MEKQTKLTILVSTSFLAWVGAAGIAVSTDRLSASGGHNFYQTHNERIETHTSLAGPAQLSDLTIYLKQLESTSPHEHTKRAAKAALELSAQLGGAPAQKLSKIIQKFNEEIDKHKLSESARHEGQAQGLPEEEKKFLEVARTVTQKSLKMKAPSREDSKHAMIMLTKRLEEKGLADFFEKEEISRAGENAEVTKMEDAMGVLESKLSHGSLRPSERIKFYTKQYNLYRKQAGLAEVSHGDDSIEVTQEDVKHLIKQLTEKLYQASMLGVGDEGHQVGSEMGTQKKVPLAQQIKIFEETYTAMGMDDEGEAKRNAWIKQIFNEILRAPEENTNNLNEILKFLFQNQYNGENIGERQAQFAKWYYATAQLHPKLRRFVIEFENKYNDYLEAMAIGPAGEHWNIVRTRYGAKDHFSKYTVNPENLHDRSYIKGRGAVPLIHLLAKNPMQLMDGMSVKNAKIYTSLLPHTPFEVLDALYYLFWKLGVKEKEGVKGPENIARSAFIRKLKEIHEAGEDHWKVTPLPEHYDPYVDFFGSNTDGDYTRYWEERKNDIGEILSPPAFNTEGEYVPGSEENVARSLERDAFELEDKTMRTYVNSMDRKPKVSVQSDEHRLAELERAKEERKKEALAKNQAKELIQNYLKQHVGHGKEVEIKGAKRQGTLNKLTAQFLQKKNPVTPENIAGFMASQELKDFQGEEKDVIAMPGGSVAKKTPEKIITPKKQPLSKEEITLKGKINNAIFVATGVRPGPGDSSDLAKGIFMQNAMKDLAGKVDHEIEAYVKKKQTENQLPWKQ